VYAPYFRLEGYYPGTPLLLHPLSQPSATSLTVSVIPLFPDSNYNNTVKPTLRIGAISRSTKSGLNPNLFRIYYIATYYERYRKITPYQPFILNRFRYIYLPGVLVLILVVDLPYIFAGGLYKRYSSLTIRRVFLIGRYSFLFI